MAENNATLTLPTGEVVELPVLKGSYGPDVVDVSGLLKAGYFTYDPGFMSTAATESKITYIDGGKGVLLHRGYSIEDLAENSDFSRPAISFGTDNYLTKSKSRSLLLTSRVIRCCMNRWPTSLTDSTTMLIQWR